MGATAEILRWGPERVRTGPWRGEGQIAYLTPLPNAPAPSSRFVRRCLDQLAAQGFVRVVTSALAPAEQQGFLDAGFEVHEQLHLLGHDLRDIPPSVPRMPMRRARSVDRPAVLSVDTQAFPPFWRLDDTGLEEALQATPLSRFRVVDAPATDSTVGADVVAYAITGRAGRRGYLQRLAVDPARHRQGLGRALVIDGLRWLRRWRADGAVVNTQLGNEAALALYERLGFRREPGGLSVLAVVLDR